MNVNITNDNLYQVLRQIEAEFDIRITALTRDDADYQLKCLDDEHARNLTDEEWAAFKDSYLWRNWAEVSWDGIPDQIADALIDDVKIRLGE